MEFIVFIIVIALLVDCKFSTNETKKVLEAA